MTEVSAAAPKKPYVTPKAVQVPIFIEYSPEYKKEHGLNNEIDRLPQGSLERTPDEDGFELNEANLLGAPAMKSFKAPSGSEVVATIVLVKEIFDVLDDAAKSGKNLWQTLSEWIGGNNKMSDKEKVKAMQLGNVLAKQMSAKDAA